MPGSAKRRAFKSVSIRLSPAERDEIVAAAAACGVGPSTYVREAALRRAGLRRAAARRPSRAPDARALALFLGAMCRVNGALAALTEAARPGSAIDVERLRAVERAWGDVEARWLDWIGAGGGS